jgi:lipopolysaccharide/colanic/teichoic acid biosynthesis glycosyltransferase
MYTNLLKPLLDKLCGLVLFIMTLPLFIGAGIFLYFSNDGKPLFTQMRPGKNAKLFKIIKLKTMNDKTDAQGNLLPDDQRLTNIGSFIRKTSLDELPQLINVIKGDMSFVGPRPLLPEYLPLYSSEQSARHDVKPGITGWAQINGRNAISWKQKFEYDVWYVNHQSFMLDLQILGRTAMKVMKSEGISNGTQATTTKFTGN